MNDIFMGYYRYIFPSVASKECFKCDVTKFISPAKEVLKQQKLINKKEDNEIVVSLEVAQLIGGFVIAVILGLIFLTFFPQISLYIPVTSGLYIP